MRVRRKFTTRLLASVLSLAVAQAVAVTTITTGSFLVISEPATFASGAITFAGSGTIVFTGSGVLGNDVVLFPGVLGTFNTNGQNDTLAGLLTGQGMLVKQGGGVLTLPGANSFAGGTSVVAGTLAVGSNTALGSGMLSINGGGLLANKDVLLANRLSLGDSFTIAAATGTTLAVGAGGWGIADAADMTIGSSNATGTVVWATPAGSGGHANINVAGGTLKGADSLFGKLLLNAAASLRVASGATLDLGGSGAILPAALSGDGRITSSSGAPTLRLNGGSFGGTIDGALALEVDGQTVLSGTSTHTGGTSIGPGATLQLGDGGAGGSIGGNVQNHGTLTVNRSDDMLFGGLISGSGRLVKLGAGSLALPVANTFSGGSTLAAGTLALGSGAALGNGLLTITGGTLLATRDMTLGNRLGLGGSFTIAAATGTTFAVGGGGWSMAANTSMVIGGAVANGTVLWASQGGSITSPGPAITLAGGIFRGADPTSIDVLLRSADSLQIGALATLDLGGYDATLPAALSGSGRITSGKGAPTLNLMGGDFGGSIDGALALNVVGRATLSGANTYTGGTTIGRFAVLQLGNGGLGGSIDGDIQMIESGDLRVFQTSDLVIGSVISGTGSLVKQGIGKLTLRGPNTFSGGVLMQGGTLAGDNDMALGTGLLIVRGGTLLGIANAVLGNGFVGANAFTIAAAAGTTLTVGGPGSALRQSTTIDPTSMNIGSADATGTVQWAPGFTASPVRDSRSEINVVSGTFKGADAGLGLLMGQAGTLRVFDGATLDLGGFNADLPAQLMGRGRITSSSGAPTLGVNGGDFGGTIDSKLALQVSGLKTILRGANSYAGGTTINRGATLQLGNFSELDDFRDTGSGVAGGSIIGNVLNNGSLMVNQHGNLLLSGVISGSGDLVKAGSGVLALTGNNSFSGGVTLGGGTLAVNNGMAAGTGRLTISGRTVQSTLPTLLLGTANTTLDNVLELRTRVSIAAAAGTTLALGSGAWAIADNTELTIGNVDAPGTVLWSSPAGSSGRAGIDVAAGTFKGADSGFGTRLLANASSVRVAAGATLDLGGFDATLPSTPSGSGRITSSGGAPVLSLGAGEFSGSIDSALTLRLFDLTTLIGTNSYTGGTRIESSAGLALGNGGNGGSITGDVQNNGVLFVNQTGDLLLGGVISGAGTLVKQGGGVLTLTGAGTYMGGTTVSAGTLQLGNGGAGGSILGYVRLDGGTLAVNQSSDLALDGALFGSGALVKQGAGRLTLTAENSFSGGSTLANGTLAVARSTALGTGALTITGGRLLGIADVTLGNGLNLNQRFTLAALPGASLTLGGGGVNLATNTAMTIGGPDATGTVAWAAGSGVGSGPGGPAIELAGGTFKGAAAGFATLLNNAASLRVDAGATLDLAGFNASLPAALSGKGRIFSSSGTPTLGVNGGSFGGSIEGALALEVTALTTFTAASTYTGGTTIAHGATLQLGNGGAGGSIVGDLLANGKLTVNQASDLLLDGVISGNGALIKQGTGTLKLGGSSTFGSVEVGKGDLRLPSTLRVTGTVVNAGSIAAEGLVTIGGNLVNSGSIGFSGSNTVVSGKLTNNAGATLQVSYNTAAFNGDVVNNGTIKTAAATTTFSGSFTNNGAFVSDPATQIFQDITLGAEGSLQGGAGDVFVVNGNMANYSQASGSFNLDAARLVFSSGAHSLTWGAANRGATGAGYERNFAVGSFEIAAGGSLLLSGSAATASANALYVREFVLDGGLAQLSGIQSNGVSIYYDPAFAANAYLSGRDYALDGAGRLMAVAAVPEPRTQVMLLAGLALMGLVARRRRLERHRGNRP